MNKGVILIFSGAAAWIIGMILIILFPMAALLAIIGFGMFSIGWGILDE